MRWIFFSLGGEETTKSFTYCSLLLRKPLPDSPTQIREQAVTTDVGTGRVGKSRRDPDLSTFWEVLLHIYERRLLMRIDTVAHTVSSTYTPQTSLPIVPATRYILSANKLWRYNVDQSIRPGPRTFPSQLSVLRCLAITSDNWVLLPWLTWTEYRSTVILLPRLACLISCFETRSSYYTILIQAFYATGGHCI